jgi:hypothetical protein
MEQNYTVTLTKTELEALSKIVRRSLGNTRNKQKRIMLGLLYDELTATLNMEMILAAQKNLEFLQKDLAAYKKAEQRKHLQVVK